MSNKQNVFEGPAAIKDFLNPGKNTYLPLVELPATLNPFTGDKVRIFAKMLNMMALGNVKAAPAFNMIEEKHLSGELEGVKTIVENSSGNTVSSVALVARHFGINDIKSYVPSEISWHKLLMLLFFGIEPIVNAEPKNPVEDDPESGITKAKKDAQKADVLNPGQYDNPANPRAHERWLGGQIWDQTDGKINVFCAALGTTGTIIGHSQFLKAKNADVQIVGTMRAPDNYVPGPRTEKLLKLVGFDWQSHVDAVEAASAVESYQLSMELSRRGIIAGPSSGLGLVGLRQYLAGLKAANLLDNLRDKETSEIICVFPCPDGPLPYLTEYFENIDKSQFPKIQNEDLLINKP